MTARENYEIWLKKADDADKAELIALEGKEKEIAERFSMPLAFGTAGMRGEVGIGTYRMNLYTVRRAARGVASWINTLGETAKKKGVIISYDTRRFSYDFAFASAQVLKAAGIRSYVFENVRPVPLCSYAVRKLNAQAGIMITASHNPKEYNGFKVYGSDGAQMSPEDTAEVVKYIDKTDYFDIPCEKTAPPVIKGMDNVALDEFITVIGASLDEEYYKEIEKLSLSDDAVKAFGGKLKLVYTPLHGSGAKPVTDILTRKGLNFSVVEEQFMPDTEFSTVSAPNPENEEALKMGIELGKKIGANVVIGTDPDCDRMGLAVRDNEGNFVLLNGNQIGVLIMDYILSRLQAKGELPANGAVIKTIVTTTLADKVAESYNVKAIDVLTGFKFIGEKIKEWEVSNEHTYLFGYEESYGYLRGTHARDKDAVVASMLAAEMACYYESLGGTLYERLVGIFEKFGYYREENSSVTYKGLEGMRIMADTMERMRGTTLTEIGGEKIIFTADYLKGIKTGEDIFEKLTLPKTDALYYGLKDGQFICIRPSGTEPKLKAYVLVFSDSAAAAKEKAKRLMTAIKEIL